MDDSDSGAKAAGWFVLLHPDDNVLICAATAPAGTPVAIDGTTYTVPVEVQLGHKVARYALAAGDKVRRYGIPIGTMTAPALPAEHVHRHNLVSDYIPSHDRDVLRAGH